MKHDINNEIKKFISILKTEKNNCMQEDFAKTYDHAIKRAESVIENGKFRNDKFHLLSRYVSDSLPWTEEALKIWNRIEKLIS